MSPTTARPSRQLKKKFEALNTPPVKELPEAPKGSEVPPANLPANEGNAPPAYVESIAENGMPPEYVELYTELENTPAADQPFESLPTPNEPPGGPRRNFLQYLARLGKQMLCRVWGSIRDFISFIAGLIKRAEDQPDSTPIDFEKAIKEHGEKQKARDADSIDEAGKKLQESLRGRSPEEQRRGLEAWEKILGWVGAAWNAFRTWVSGACAAIVGGMRQFVSSVQCVLRNIGNVFLNAWRWFSGTSH